MNRLQEVYKLGQSIWYDNIRRGLIESGELQRLIDEDAVVGITSNPTIFEKAIDGGMDYDDQLRELVSQGVTDPGQVFEALAIRDIQMAADVLRPIYDRTSGGDGFISLEVSPAAANDTKRTIAEARHLNQRADRPNVMIKIPATAEGIPAIEQMIYEGVNINITLIFSLDIYAQVTEAYIKGLENRLKEGLPITGIHSVASFFVSRVDSLVDKLLETQIAATSDTQRQQELRALRGKAAIANARMAYQKYKEIFHGPRFAPLLAQGATMQRCLWASTSTKNPAYRDVLYMEALIGPETVDTVPPQTIVAFQDHGVVSVTIEDDIPGQIEALRQLGEAGISMDEVTKQLEIEGVKSFTDSFNKLIESTAEKTARLKSASDGTAATAKPAATASSLVERRRASLGGLGGAVETALARADAEHYEQRIWKKDPALWKPNATDQREIVDRLGWLTVMEQMADALVRLRSGPRVNGTTQ
ncbi:MAG: transaldolase, partial [Ktedonobacterales bacterium]|nr:transaldolase [Ktedonobacterales bacterium]